MSSTRGLVLRTLLAFLLVFAQQQVVLHALGHDFERIHASTKDLSTHDDAACAKCLALAQLDHANGVAVASIAAVPYEPPRVVALALADTSPAPVRAYLSRAPPHVS